MVETKDPGAALMSTLASNQEQRNALQYAFYNTLLLVLLGISLCGMVALYNMLYMFLSPMLWAVLVGTVLFPFKKKVSEVMKGWLGHLQETETTFVVGLISLPFTTIWSCSSLIYTTVMSQTGVMIGAAYLLLKILSYDRTFMYIISWLGRVYESVDTFILFFAKPWVFPIIVIYFIAFATWIYVQEPEKINKKVARSLSLPIWVYALSCISLYAGPFRAVVFGVSSGVLALLSAGVLGVDETLSPNNSQNDIVGETDAENETATDMPAENVAPANIIEELQNETAIEDGLDGALSGDRLIRVIFCLCGLLWVVRHDSALVVISIMFFFALAIRAANRLGLTDFLCGFIESVWSKIHPGLLKMVHITVAGPLRQFVRFLFTSDQLLVSSLHSRMDVLSSVVVMMFLAFSTLFAVFFVGFQVHGETVHLVRLTSNVVSSRPDWLGAALNYTEDQLEDHNIDIDNYIEQAYQQGRAWLAANARSLSDGKDPHRADMLEKQVKQIVDNIYRMWEERNAAVQDDSSSAVTRGDLWSQMQGVTDLHALKEEITVIIKDNVDTLMGIAQSLWSIIALNLSFLSSILAACAGVILGFGMDIANFLIEVIVFLTMVYYLLSGSTDRWLPLEWASRLVAVSQTAARGEYDVTAAVEHAIFGVFVLSAKMAVFYGLYTYFVHSLFDLNIVFVPSMLASLFAAIPIMAPYFVCVFGVFELWLVRGESAAALVFAIMSFAPLMFADATFYREVKGSHPYVTGLAIIGGMYWLGLQGAIIGPIILCTFLVLVNVYMQFVKPVEPEEKKTKKIA